MESLEQIWQGDLFDRRQEAEDLIGYLESVAGRPVYREDGHAHVLAVDTTYGQGKTFFLRRLNRHLRATDHVSAFVDAWVDDLEDEPIVALAATLEDALMPWLEQSGDVGRGMADFKVKAGRVAKIVSVGLAKRGIGFLITQGAAEALGDEIAKGNDVQKDAAKDTLKDGGAGLVTDVATALGEAAMPGMDARIAKFREGQAAIAAMKSSLAEVVTALTDAGMKLPITIIVDELDRCRPTYAIKVLEEIKHLFDVDGVAFVLGLHGGQLAHSIGAAYGANFDGEAYLRRFISRRYVLRGVAMERLVAHLIDALKISVERLSYPNVIPEPDVRRSYKFATEVMIAGILNAYGVTARETYAVMEALQTALALTKPRSLLLVYLLPLIICHVLPGRMVSDIKDEPSWKFVYFSDTGGEMARKAKELSLYEIVKQSVDASKLSAKEISRLYSSSSASYAVELMAENSLGGDAGDYASPANYSKLVMAVSRFE